MNDIRQAEFEVRDRCITCGSLKLKKLSEGRFTDKPLFDFLSADPFGEDPLPHLQDGFWCFVQCEDCGQKFHQNVLNEEWNGIYYNRWISSEAIEEHSRNLGNFGFHADFARGKHAVERILQIERLTRKLRGSDQIKVLDFGCGEGRFLSTAASFGFECVGVEFSKARNKTKLIDFLGDMGQVEKEYGPKYFHAVVLFEVLEHLSRPLEILKEIRPFIKDGGILILETPNCPDVTGIKSLRDYRLISPLGHINAFTPDTQEKIAQKAGFRRISTSTVQCSADQIRVYKREARRFLSPFMKRYTQQYFSAA